MIQRLLARWKQYRYRFVPWIALNLKDRSMRKVPKGTPDKVVLNEVVEQTLIRFFSALDNEGIGPNCQARKRWNNYTGIRPTHRPGDDDRYKYELSLNESKLLFLSEEQKNLRCNFRPGQHKLQTRFPTLFEYKQNDSSAYSFGSDQSDTHVSQKYESREPDHRKQKWLGVIKTLQALIALQYLNFALSRELSYLNCGVNSKEMYSCHFCQSYENMKRKTKISVDQSRTIRSLEIMENHMGFTIERQQSLLKEGGTGVFVTKGIVPKGSVVAMYPGAIYQPFEPVFWQSLGNPFIFRCIDRVLVDGNDKGLSKFLYRSCAQRDRVGPFLTCDLTWLTKYPINPLAVGQYVNNHSKEFPPNVAYQEFDVPDDFPFHLRQYIPNVFYTGSGDYHTSSHRLTKTVVLVALREIQQNEELFSSYFTVVH